MSLPSIAEYRDIYNAIHAKRREESQRTFTPGEKAVGLTFNPSGDEKVNELKQLFAKTFDIVEQCVPADDGTVPTARLRKMRDSALEAIITAQMWSVKVATLKY
jgi:hypothetical protein